MSRPCPCGAKATFDKHCQPILAGKIFADSAERLMRARFSAYSIGDVDFLIKTTAMPQREQLDAEELEDYCLSIRCISLKILATEAGGPKDETGMVRFHASMQVDGKRRLHSETSHFHREDGQWVYESEDEEGGADADTDSGADA